MLRTRREKRRRLPAGAPLPGCPMSEITELIHRVNAGDAAARESLFAVLYQDLRTLARSRLRRSETITLLDTTSLVHESYLRYVNSRDLEFADRGKFFAYAASVMRSIIVDQVRKRRAERRGGSAEHLTLNTDAVDSLARDAEDFFVVEMRYFAGLSENDIAAALGVTDRTVRRDWDKARTLLFNALR